MSAEKPETDVVMAIREALFTICPNKTWTLDDELIPCEVCRSCKKITTLVLAAVRATRNEDADIVNEMWIDDSADEVVTAIRTAPLPSWAKETK